MPLVNNYYLKSFKTYIALNVAIYWDMVACSLYVNQYFGGTYHIHHQGKKSAEVIRPSETSVRLWTTWLNIPEDGSIRNYHCERREIII
jgi:hypothetical protein